MSFDAGSITSNMKIDVSPFRQGMLEAQGIASVFGQNITNFVASPLLGIVGIAKQAGQAIAGALQSGIGTGLKLAADAESAAIAFEVLLGSAAKAKSMLADVSKFAAATPFELPELVQTTKLLLGFGFAAEKVMPTLKQIGDVAAISEKPIKDLGLIYAQVFAKTKLQGEELMQLAEAGVPIRRELEKLTGLSGGAFDKFVEAGKVNFPLFEQAFGNLSAKGGQFADGMDKASKGAKGLASTLADSQNALLRGLGEGFAEGLGLKELLGDATTALDGFQATAKAFGTELGSALRPIVGEIMGWVKTHPEEAKAKVQEAARTIVSAVKSVGDAAKALLPVAGFVAEHLKEIAAGAVVLGAARALLTLAEAYRAVAVSAAAATAAQAGGAAASGGGFASAAGRAGVAGLAGAGVVAAYGGGTGAVVGGGLGGAAGFLGGAKLGGLAGGLLGPAGATIGAVVGGVLGAAGGTKIGEQAGAQVDLAGVARRHGGALVINIQPGENADEIARRVGQLTTAELAKFYREREAAEAARAAVRAGL
jgi:tape measure domain-containing protein